MKLLRVILNNIVFKKNFMKLIRESGKELNGHF